MNSYKGSERKILIVEDDSELANTISDTINEAAQSPSFPGLQEFHIDLAYTYSGAIQLLERTDPKTLSLVIFDIILPDGDGRNLLKKIRNDVHTAHIPAIAISGYNENQALFDECQSLGANAVFRKPWNTLNFLSTIQRLTIPSANAKR